MSKIMKLLLSVVLVATMGIFTGALADSKCGAGKCGDAKELTSNCKCSKEKNCGKCGDGSCNCSKNKNCGKCGSSCGKGKCGSDSANGKNKCGSSKCGS